MRKTKRQARAGIDLNVRRQAMHSRLFGTLARLGITRAEDRNERLLLIGDLVGYPVNSTRHLPEADTVRAATVLERLLERLQECGLLDATSRGDFLVWAVNDGVPFTLARIDRKLSEDVMRWNEERSRVEAAMASVLR